MGTRAYSFIQQGQIDLILSTKPKDRRQLLEEAAGITRYKARRAEAERRLDETRANLQRLDDLLFELGKQQDSLKRQAAKARRALELDKELKETKRVLLAGKAMELEEAKGINMQALDALEGEIAQLTAQAAENASAVERQRLALHKFNEQRDQQTKSINDIDNKLGKLEQERGFCETRAKEAEDAAKQANERITALDSKRGDWAAEIGAFEKKQIEAQKALAAREALLQEADEAVALARGALTAIESEIKSLQAKRAEAAQAAIQKQKKRQGLMEQIAKLEGRLDTLNHEEAVRAPQLDKSKKELQSISKGAEGAEERFLEMDEAVAVQAGRRDDAQGALRACEGSYREAEGAFLAEGLRLDQLSDALNSAHSPGAFKKALAWLKAQGIAPTSLIDALEIDEEARPDLERVLGNWVNTVAWKNDGQGLKKLPGQLLVSIGQGKPQIDAPAQTRPLAASVRWQKKVPKVLIGLIARTFRCSDDDFGGMASAHPELAFVSPSFVKLPFGPLQAGYGPPAASPIKMKADIEASRAARDALLERMESLETQKKELAQTAAEAQGRLEEMEEDRTEAKRSLEDMKTRMASTVRQIKEIEEAQQRADEMWESFEKEITKLKAAIKEIDCECPEGSEGAIDNEVSAAENKRLEAQAHLNERRDVFTEAATMRASAWSEKDSVDRQLQHIKRAAFDSDAEKKRLEADRSQAADRRATATARIAEVEQEAQILLNARAATIKDQTGLLPKIEGTQDALRVDERKDRESKGALENARQLYTDSKIQAASVSGKIEAAATEIELALGMSINDFLNSITAAEKEAWEQGQLIHETRLSDLESKRLDLGSVNPLAIQELEEAEARLALKNEQRADVIEAIANLEATIAEINATSEERFREAFEFINLRFQEVFRQVFGGGSAHLSLQDPKDLLECGIEIMAQPPGKTAKALTLLSGGEKALTAISLLFAIFYFKPSPFCVLDEVDAPLDEANVGRFVGLVNNMKGHTQFVVITHQKPTMVAADTLYGVTMEEKGISRLVSVQLKEAEKLV
jgi:chromosome segregation protein